MKKILSVFSTFFIIMIVIIFIAVKKSNNTSEEIKKIKVVATLFPQYDFAKQIGKDKVEVELLLPPRTETHAYDPSPKDMIRINKSNLFVYTGRYMEPWAESIASNVDKNVLVVDASKNITYIKEEHDDIEEHEKEHEYDPHIWLDISNAKIMVDNIRDALIEKDFDNKEYYIKNAKEYKEELDILDKKIEDTVSSSNRNIMCFGDKFAYMYFIKKYNLDYITAYDSCLTEAEPSVSKILDIEEKIKKENIPVIFYESLSEGTIAKSIANDTGIKALVFSSVHTVSNENIKNGATYISIMEENLKNLKQALY